MTTRIFVKTPKSRQNTRKVVKTPKSGKTIKNGVTLVAKLGMSKHGFVSFATKVSEILKTVK